MAVSFSGWVPAPRNEPLDRAGVFELVQDGQAKRLRALAMLADDQAGVEKLLGPRT
jgi:hypothetical protein